MLISVSLALDKTSRLGASLARDVYRERERKGSSFELLPFPLTGSRAAGCPHTICLVSYFLIIVIVCIEWGMGADILTGEGT